MFPSKEGIIKGIWTGGSAKNENFRFFNNLIFTHGDIPLLDIAPAKEFLFTGNAYWNSDNKFLMRYDGESFNSLDSWTQSTHQESSKNVFTIGMSIDPKITLSDSNPIVGDPHRLHTLQSFQLNSTHLYYPKELIYPTMESLRLSMIFGAQKFYRKIQILAHFN